MSLHSEISSNEIPLLLHKYIPTLGTMTLRLTGIANIVIFAPFV